MSNAGEKKSRVGEIRPSQLLTEFGVGSIVDLPSISVMVMGLDDWEQQYQQSQEIGEDRLRLAVQQWLGRQVQHLRTPPVPPEGAVTLPFAQAGIVGVPVVAFPRWMVCPYCHLLAPVESGLFQLKGGSYQPDRVRYVHTNCTKPGLPVPVLPARFLAVCERGHLDDFPWIYFVHGGPTDCNARLRLREHGFSADVADVRVQCETCGLSRSMAEAFGKGARKALPLCRGRHPHLRDFEENECPQQTKTLVLGASNSWFPVILSALSVPKEGDALGQLIDLYWLHLERAANVQNIELMRSLGLIPLLGRHRDEDIWEAIQRKRAGAPVSESEARDLKKPEWNAFTQGRDILDYPSFRIRHVAAPPDFEHIFTQVVLVDRLREVKALIGFTRLASLGDMVDSVEGPSGTEFPEERLVDLSRKPPKWVPAFEVHGEGIFLQFREKALAEWFSSNPALQAYDEGFHKAHASWRARRRIPQPEAYYPGMRYVLLHSFAHALMRQLALEAGYSMASLSERIYAREPRDEGGPMAGILISTSAPDSEGTLGGLVSLGTSDILGHHLHAALESIRWCAADPLCASHEPRTDTDALHGAACYACLFVPETSCERGNRYLDRSLLLPTIEHQELAFFPVDPFSS